VAAGVGIAVVPEAAARRCARFMPIMMIKIRDPWANRKLAICARSLEGARDYFLAVDISAPFDASSYQFPFCRASGGDIVASKVGWRQSFVAQS
jgi:hypothetical protein